MRTEFGLPRTTCGCDSCVTNCRYMPGFLIPQDLERLIPPGIEGPAIYEWAERNLLASPGALAMDTTTGNTFRIGTLVPAVKPDGSCIHLTADRLCDIHPAAPFGCAFFDCGPERNGVSRDGLMAVLRAHREGLYGQIWRHLWNAGQRQKPPEELRARMRREAA